MCVFSWWLNSKSCGFSFRHFAGGVWREEALQQSQEAVPL